MTPQRDNSRIQLALPKGRIQKGTERLLADAGINVRTGLRGYRPTLSVPGFEAKLLKPQSIVQMLAAGSRDIGFCGADWVAELDCDLIELFDTELDPVRIVAAAPAELLENGALPKRPLVVASEYPQLTKRWIAESGIDATFVRSYGATEVFPPEDADVIVDNTATGETLAANGLVIIDELMRSSTRLFARRDLADDPGKEGLAAEVVMLLRSVVDARRRVMLELNVDKRALDQVVEVLPCMREATVSDLRGGEGYAVRAAVPRETLPALVPALKARGGTAIIVTSLNQIVP